MSDLLNQFQYKGTFHKADEQPVCVKNVSMSYKSLAEGRESAANMWALENISFSINKGEQIAIIGPNGAGKSTLFKLIIGMLKPDQGSISLFGALPEKHICIGYVPQRNVIDWHFPVTVADVVMMGRTRQIGLFRRPGKEDRKVVAQSLERVGAGHLAEKQIGALSGGQQQRVFIARALALETTLLLMDEPLAGLDIPTQESIFEILSDLKQDDVTVMVATHDLGFAEKRFDKIMLINRQLVAFGPPSAVVTTPNLLAAYGGKLGKITSPAGGVNGHPA